MIRASWVAVALLVAAVWAIVLLGLSELDSGSLETWAGVMLLATAGVLMLATIGAVCRGPHTSPRSTAFAVFGWGYFALAHWYAYHQGPLPTVGFLPGAGTLHGDLRTAAPLVRLAYDAWTLAFAVLGSVVAGLLSKRPTADEPGDLSGAQLYGQDRGWWRRPVWLGLLISGLVVAATLAGWRWDADLGAGTAFLFTWALAGLMGVGAVSARGRAREVWLGAASFGLGYLILAFGPVCPAVLPTNHLLNAIVRPGGPTTDDIPDEDLTSDEQSHWVQKALEEPITLHFPGPTSLKVVLDRIRDAARRALGKDPFISAVWHNGYKYEIAELDHAMVFIDRENIPAGKALQLCLAQLGWTYRVQSGGVRIFPDAYEPIPFEKDPVMIAGHSLLALIAAAIGGVAAPIIAGLWGRQGADRGRDPDRPHTAIGVQASS